MKSARPIAHQPDDDTLRAAALAVRPSPATGFLGAATGFLTRAAAAVLVVGLASCDISSPTAPAEPQNLQQCLDQASFDAPSSSPYCLPWAAGLAFQVSQSYCSPPPLSHHRRYAYDFPMPSGTEVLAARAGLVVELREQWPDDDTQGGHENVVILRHDDDTLSLYIHMKQNGVLVELGDFVPRGGLLGLSGSSGTGFPHLHFQVCLRGGECTTGVREITLPVNFRNAQGGLDPRGGLREGESYVALPCE